MSSVLYLLVVVIYAILALILLPILGTLVSSGQSENLRFPWFVVTTSDCKNTTLPQFRNNNNILNQEGWNIYPAFGFCPANGIVSKYFANSVNPTSRRLATVADSVALVVSPLDLVDTVEQQNPTTSRRLVQPSYRGGPQLSGAGDPHYTYTYSGCIPFTDASTWTAIDDQNRKVGYRSEIASGADNVGKMFGPLMVAAVVFFWFFGIVGVLVSVFVHVPVGLGMAVFGYAFAWALWLSAYVVLISSDLIVSNSYVNSFFAGCSVNIQWGHGAVVHIVVLFIGGFSIVMPFVLYMAYMCGQPAPGSFLHPGFKEVSGAKGVSDEEGGDEEEGKGEEEEVRLVEKPRTLQHFHSTLVGGDHKAAVLRVIDRLRGRGGGSGGGGSPSGPAYAPAPTAHTASTAPKAAITAATAGAPHKPTHGTANPAPALASSPTRALPAPTTAPPAASASAGALFAAAAATHATARYAPARPPGEVEHEDVFTGGDTSVDIQGAISPHTREALRSTVTRPTATSVATATAIANTNASVNTNANAAKQPPTQAPPPRTPPPSSSSSTLPPPPPAAAPAASTPSASAPASAPASVTVSTPSRTTAPAPAPAPATTATSATPVRPFHPDPDPDPDAFDDADYREELEDLAAEEDEIARSAQADSAESKRRLQEIRAMRKAIELECAQAREEYMAGGMSEGGGEGEDGEYGEDEEDRTGDDFGGGDNREEEGYSSDEGGVDRSRNSGVRPLAVAAPSHSTNDDVEEFRLSP